jgi:hypothetical protein
MSVTTYTFTPSAAGKLIVTCRYDGQLGFSGSDWSSSGNFIRGRAYVTQSGATTYGASRGLTSARASYTVTMIADVVAGVSVQCGLEAQVGGLVTGTFWDIHVKVELIKR